MLSNCTKAALFKSAERKKQVFISTLKFSLKLCRKYQNVQPYLVFSLIVQISLPKFYLQLLKQSDIIEIKYAIFCLSGDPNLLKFTGSI